MSKLKDCPFCHKLAEKHVDSTGKYIVQCTYCGTSKDSTYSMEAAVSSWNRRDSENVIKLKKLMKEVSELQDRFTEHQKVLSYVLNNTNFVIDKSVQQCYNVIDNLLSAKMQCENEINKIKQLIVKELL